MTDASVSCSRTVAMYKGQKVTVYTVDKTEISLSRQDLIELINVCSLFIYLLLSMMAVSVSFH